MTIIRLLSRTKKPLNNRDIVPPHLSTPKGLSRPFMAHYAHAFYAPVAGQRVILHSETVFAPRPDTWSACERDVDAVADIRSPAAAAPSKRSGVPPRRAKAHRGSPAPPGQKLYQYP